MISTSVCYMPNKIEDGYVVLLNVLKTESIVFCQIRY